MANNGPISISKPGISLVGATSKDISFSTRYPFHKLDSTNPVSFQVLTVFLAKDTPTPAASPGNTATNRTLVYQYPHGYSYVPSSWFLVSTDNFATVLGSEGSWIIGSASGVSPAVAKFEVDIDAINVNFYIFKQWTNDGTTPEPSVLGYFITVRAYIFLDDLSATGVPSKA